MVLESLNFILIKLTYVVLLSLYCILIAACIPLDEYITIYSSILLPTRHLGFSQVFDVVYGATITFVYIFPGAYVQEFLVHIYVKAKCWKCGRLTLWDNDRTIFPGSCANLLAGYEILCLSTCPSTWYEQTFQFFQPNTCKIASHVALNCISRHITNDLELFLILSLPHVLPCLYL